MIEKKSKTDDILIENPKKIDCLEKKKKKWFLKNLFFVLQL